MGSCMSGLSGRTKASRLNEQHFLESYPAYKETQFVDHLRKTEYSTLDRDGHTYLDYTGAGLYSEMQLRDHQALLSANIFGNPHSLNPTSSAMTKLDEEARASVLNFFRASPDEYTVIFTANASGALKLLGEAYPFSSKAEYLLLADNHNSVQGIREFARAKGAVTTQLPLTSPDLRTDGSVVEKALRRKSHSDDGPRLFAYPAQSNFSGVQHPLEWISAAQAQGCHVLLDAAAFVPTNRLDLSIWHPDFVPISFYKMFGYPSGVGCLIARKDALATLTRPWFAGGTVWGSSALGDKHVLLEHNEAFEDGTINFLNLPAVQMGLAHLHNIGMEVIHQRVTCLTHWVIKELASLHHQDGRPLVKIYGPQDQHMRGGTIAFNFIDAKGMVVDERIVEKRGNTIKLSLRSGCFCNPGTSEAAFDIRKETLVRAFHGGALYEAQHGERKKWDDFLFDLGLPTAGALRISLGLVSNFADVYCFIQFAKTFLDSVPAEEDLVARVHC